MIIGSIRLNIQEILSKGIENRKLFANKPITEILQLCVDGNSLAYDILTVRLSKEDKQEIEALYDRLKTKEEKSELSAGELTFLADYHCHKGESQLCKNYLKQALSLEGQSHAHARYLWVVGNDYDIYNNDDLWAVVNDNVIYYDDDAEKYLKQAAQENHTGALLALGDCSQSPVEAYKLYLEAAALGNSRAMRNVIKKLVNVEVPEGVWLDTLQTQKLSFKEPGIQDLALADEASHISPVMDRRTINTIFACSYARKMIEADFDKIKDKRACIRGLYAPTVFKICLKNFEATYYLAMSELAIGVKIRGSDTSLQVFYALGNYHQKDPENFDKLLNFDLDAGINVWARLSSLLELKLESRIPTLSAIEYRYRLQLENYKRGNQVVYEAIPEFPREIVDIISLFAGYKIGAKETEEKDIIDDIKAHNKKNQPK